MRTSIFDSKQAIQNITLGSFAEGPIESNIEHGRQKLLQLIYLVLVANLIGAGFHIYMKGAGRESVALSVLTLVIYFALFAWLYRGGRVAKWTVTCVLGIQGLIGQVNWLSGHPVAMVYAAIFVAFLWAAYRLVKSTSINDFLIYQRSKKSAA